MSQNLIPTYILAKYIASYIATFNCGEIIVEVITHYTHYKISVEHILCMYIRTSVP